MKNLKYLSVLKMAGIQPDIGEIICLQLNEHILERLTKPGFDRRLIKPVLRKAKNEYGEISDYSVEQILNNQNLIALMIAEHCK